MTDRVCGAPGVTGSRNICFIQDLNNHCLENPQVSQCRYPLHVSWPLLSVVSSVNKMILFPTFHPALSCCIIKLICPNNQNPYWSKFKKKRYQVKFYTQKVQGPGLRLKKCHNSPLKCPSSLLAQRVPIYWGSWQCPSRSKIERGNPGFRQAVCLQRVPETV